MLVHRKTDDNGTADDYNDNSNSDDDGDDHRFAPFFHSIRTKTGLEIGIRVTWPGVEPFEISTCLPEDTIAPIFDGTQWAGTCVWRAAVVALKYLLSEACPLKVTAETTVIELGCGLGIPGIILALSRSCPTLLSDKQSLLEQLQRNLQKLPHPEARCLQACALDWSVSDVQAIVGSFGRPFDLVLNCDCIYEPLYGESWKYLAHCQTEFLRHNPKAFVLTSVERRKDDGIDKYLHSLTRSETIESVTRITLPFDHPSEVELYRINGKSTAS